MDVRATNDAAGNNSSVPVVISLENLTVVRNVWKLIFAFTENFMCVCDKFKFGLYMQKSYLVLKTKYGQYKKN